MEMPLANPIPCPLIHRHTCVHNGNTHACTLPRVYTCTHTHMPTASWFPQVTLFRDAKGQEVPVQVPAWLPSAKALWPGLSPTAGFSALSSLISFVK